MKEKELLQTLTAIKIALQSGMCEDKNKMKMAIRIGLGFANNALEESEKEKTITEEMVYDDSNPEYIKSSQEEI